MSGESQVVLLTGGARGIGLAACKKLAEKDVILYATYRKSSKTEKLETLAKQFPGKVIPLCMDLCSDASVEQGVEEVIKKEGRIDILINNAGAGLLGSLESTSIKQAQDLFDTNFFGPMRLLHAVLPIMRSQHSGKIINISSGAGFRPSPALSVYAATKFALEAISESTAVALKPWNIKVCIIEPGPVNTNFEPQVTYGERFSKEEDPYFPYFKKAGLYLEDLLKKAQPVSEVAEIIADAALNPEAPFRIQTSHLVRKNAENIWKDPSGKANLENLAPMPQLP